MKSSRLSRLNARRAFTLIELLVVILILAILAAMIVPRYFSRVDEAKRSKALEDVNTLEKLIQVFRLDNGRYPTSEEGLQALRTNPGDLGSWRGPYTTNPIPADPWGNEYVYESPGVSGEDDTFTISSYGADGAPGGEGNNADIVSGGEELQ